jgi:uncharacterized protein YbjQ (UPF0145 family)
MQLNSLSNSLSNSPKKIKLQTTSFVDNDKYDTIGIVMGVSVRAISTLRQAFTNIVGIAGGRQASLENKLISARKEAIDELLENAKLAGADEVFGINVDMFESKIGEHGFFIVSTTGTSVKIKK